MTSTALDTVITAEEAQALISGEASDPDTTRSNRDDLANGEIVYLRDGTCVRHYKDARPPFTRRWA